jgi:hypothetical protein
MRSRSLLIAAMVWSCPQCRCDSLRGLFGELWHDVGVRAERQADLAVAEDLHGHPGRNPLLQKDCRGGVPGVVVVPTSA